MRDIDADPAAAELLRRDRRRAAAAEGVEDDVAFVGRGADDALEQRLGLLSGVAEALSGLGVEGRDVVPEAVNGLAGKLIEIPLALNAFPWVIRDVKATLGVHLLHALS